jgi:outer membrane protein assembly factor BamB
MKNKKIVYVCIIPILFLVLFLQCGDDDSNSARQSDFNAIEHYKLDANSPCGLTDNGEDFYLVDRYYPGKIYRISKIDGSTIESYDTPGVKPTGITWDGNNFWTTDEDSGMIYKHNTDLSVNTEYTSEDANPSGIFYGDDNKLYVSDWKAGKIYRYNPQDMELEYTFNGERNFSRYFGMGELDNRIWVCEYYTGYIIKFANDYDFSENTKYVAPWEHPTGIYLDGTNVWVIDISLRSLIKCDPPEDGE